MRDATYLTHRLAGKKLLHFHGQLFLQAFTFLSLLRAKIYCETMRENPKGFPSSLKGVKLANQGDSKFARHGNLIGIIWQDKAKAKNVAPLSTQFRPNQFSRVK